MSKIDIWIIVAIIMAIVVNPDESDLGGILVLWGNVVAAICAKAIQQENDENRKDDEKDDTTTIDGA